MQRSTSREQPLSQKPISQKHVPKIGGNKLPIKKAPMFTLDSIKEAPVRKLPVNSPKKATSEHKSKIVPAPASAPKVKKPPSKYMQEVIRMNLVNFIHAYDIHQKRKRIDALKVTRKHLATRFMKLYRAFRFKKYGEVEKSECSERSEDIMNTPYPDHI